MRRTNLLIVDIFGAFLSNSETKFEDILKKHGVDDNLIKIIKIFDPNQKIRLSEEEKRNYMILPFHGFIPLRMNGILILIILEKGSKNEQYAKMESKHWQFNKLCRKSFS